MFSQLTEDLLSRPSRIDSILKEIRDFCSHNMVAPKLASYLVDVASTTARGMEANGSYPAFFTYTTRDLGGPFAELSFQHGGTFSDVALDPDRVNNSTGKNQGLNKFLDKIDGELHLLQRPMEVTSIGMVDAHNGLALQIGFVADIADEMWEEGSPGYKE